MSKKIFWADLSKHRAKLFSAKFSKHGDRFIVVEGPDDIPYETRIKMKKNGFLRFGNHYFKRADEISLSELKSYFPETEVVSTEIAQTRILIAEEMPEVLRKATAPKDASKAAFTGLTLLNSFQAKYEPKSAMGTPIAAIPLQLANGTAKALDSIAQRRGDIDEWVCSELQYDTMEDMAAVLSPEQIDAVAVAIDNAYQTSGSICADQTGLGKGRVGAALARWAAVNDRLFVFLTVKANLFTDFIRDVVDTNSMDIIGPPFIMNNGVKILDQATNEVLFSTLKPKVHKEVLDTGILPEGTRMVMATYSQLNRGVTSKKAEFLVSICDDAHIHSDECDNAAGESNTNQAVTQAMERAGSFSFSSATHAKTAANMALYSPLLPPSIVAQEDMVKILDAGGLPLLETLSQMLAETGRLIRREHDLSDMRINLVMDHQRKDLHEEYSDDLAPILSNIIRLSRDISQWLEEKTNSPEAKKKKEQWYAVHWGIRFSNLIEQFIAACKVDLAVEQCINALLNDEKPVLVFQNTMEAIIKDISQDPEDPSRTLKKIIDESGEERAPEFKDILLLLVDRTLTAQVRKGKDEPETVQIEEPEFLQIASEIKALISKFPRLPINPMDEIKMRIEEEGKKLHDAGKLVNAPMIGEISGRSVRITEAGVEPMTMVDRNIVINNFQNGILDLLLLTKAASTGLSLHENPKVKDRRVRHMMEFQIPTNVVERIQFWGRVKRRGGTKEPKFSTLATAMSMELRRLAAENKKIEALSANVAGSKDAGIKLDVPDPINALGNKIAKRVLIENPQMAFKMGISLSLDDEDAEEELYYANRILSRLALVKSSERDAIYHTFMDAYEDALADLAAKGIHPTKPRELPGEWTIKSRELFNAGNKQDGEVFGAPVYLTTIQREDLVYPIDKDTLVQILDDRRANEEAYNQSIQAVNDYLSNNDNRGALLKAVLPKRYRSVIEALNVRGENNRVKIENEKIKSVESLIRLTEVGGMISFTGDDEAEVSAVVLGIKVPKDPADYSKPGHYFVECVVPGDESPRKVSLATLRSDPKYKIIQRSPGYSNSYSAFVGLPAGRVLKERKILDGNIFAAAQISVHRNLGATTRINMVSGEQISGVLIPVAQQNYISSIPGSTSSADVALEILEQGGEIYTNPADMSAGMQIVEHGSALRVTIPSKPKKLAAVYMTPDIIDIIGQPKGGGHSGKSAYITYEKFGQLAEVMQSRGWSFNFGGNWRKTALEAENPSKRLEPEMRP